MSELVVTTVTTETVNASSEKIALNANAVTLPTGNTSQRPSTVANGDLRYNSETGLMEGYVEGWDTVSVGPTIGKNGPFKTNDLEIAEDITIQKKLSTVSSVNTTSDYITATHSFVNGDIVQVGATTTIPTGLSANTNYYVINANTDAFQVSASRGGANVDITGAGSGTITFWKPQNAFVTGPYTVANSFTLTIANGSSIVVLGE
jgi:hypothetical protein